MRYLSRDLNFDLERVAYIDRHANIIRTHEYPFEFVPIGSKLFNASNLITQKEEKEMSIMPLNNLELVVSEKIQQVQFK
jgi:hypothetical protein